LPDLPEALNDGTTPGQLNSFLINNGGYEGCDIIWGRVPSKLTYLEQSKHDLGWLSSAAQNCNYAIIANVMNGAHWVLITGYAGGGMFDVNDPANFHSQYSYGDIVTESVYKY